MEPVPDLRFALGTHEPGSKAWTNQLYELLGKLEHECVFTARIIAERVPGPPMEDALLEAIVETHRTTQQRPLSDDRRTLLALNIQGHQITEKGAWVLAEALMKDNKTCYLNITDNQISSSMDTMLKTVIRCNKYIVAKCKLT